MKKRFSLAALMSVMAMVALIAWAFPANVMATALSAVRDTPEKDPPRSLSLTVESNVIIYAGAIVAVTNSGKAVPAADKATYSVVGRAEATVDNRGTAYSATKTITVSKGIFRWANADSIAIANLGSLVYVTDDQTVNKTGGGANIIAGTVYDVDSSGVWVDTGKIGPSGAATPTTLAVSGAATVGTTLSVSGNSTLGGATVAVTNNETVGGSLTVGTTLSVSGNSTLGGATVAVTNNETVGGTLAVTGTSTLTGAAALNGGGTSKTRGIMQGMSATAMMCQTGVVDGVAGLTITNTFSPVFTAAPDLHWRYTAGAGVHVPTNIPTITSNQFILVIDTNIAWTADGEKSN